MSIFFFLLARIRTNILSFRRLDFFFFLGDNFDGILNKTYFGEDANETENNGGETATESGYDQNYNSKEEEDSNSKSRLNADRSLMVVLPFNAANDKNVEELYTKKPFVKVIDTSSNFNLQIEEEKGEVIKFRIFESSMQFFLLLLHFMIQNQIINLPATKSIKELIKSFESSKVSIVNWLQTSRHFVQLRRS